MAESFPFSTFAVFTGAAVRPEFASVAAGHRRPRRRWRPRQPGRPPRPAAHVLRLTARHPSRAGEGVAALLHRGVEHAHAPGSRGGWDSIRVDEGRHPGSGPGSPSRRCRGCTGRTRGPPAAARALRLWPVNPAGSRSLHALDGLLERRGARVQRRAVRHRIDRQLARRVRVRELADAVVAHALGELAPPARDWWSLLGGAGAGGGLGRCVRAQPAPIRASRARTASGP